jgi:hypothetical protein
MIPKAVQITAPDCRSDQLNDSDQLNRWHRLLFSGRVLLQG